MKKALLLLLPLLFVSSLESYAALSNEMVQVRLSPDLGPYPYYLPKGYRFQGISYIETRSGQVTHLRFAKGKKLISLFSRPSHKKRRKWRTRQKGKYVIIEWQQDGRSFTLIGQERASCLLKVAESVR